MERTPAWCRESPESLEVARLAEVAVEDALVPGQATIVGLAGRRGHDPRIAEMTFSAEDHGHIAPVHLGHLDVQQGDVRPEWECRLDGRWPILGNPDLMPPEPKEPRQGIGGIPVIVRHEDTHLSALARYRPAGLDPQALSPPRADSIE